MTHPKISIATSIYPAARPYLERFFKSFPRAERIPYQILITNENIEDWQMFEKFTDAPIHNHPIPSNLPLSECRQHLFHMAKNYGAGMTIFVDSDDMLAENALDHFLEDIESFDFVCGNIRLIDDKDKDLPFPPLYDIWKTPEIANNPDQLLDGNFIGLGAIALNKNCLNKIPSIFPPDILAVDWWLFDNLLRNNCKGKLIKDLTLLYRQHANNIGAIFYTDERETLKKQAHIALTHFKNIPPSQKSILRTEALNHLILLLNSDAKIKRLETNTHLPAPWFSHVLALALNNREN